MDGHCRSGLRYSRHSNWYVTRVTRHPKCQRSKFEINKLAPNFEFGAKGACVKALTQMRAFMAGEEWGRAQAPPSGGPGSRAARKF